MSAPTPGTAACGAETAATGIQYWVLAEVDGHLVACIPVHDGALLVGDDAAHQCALGVQVAGMLDVDAGRDAVVGQDRCC